MSLLSLYKETNQFQTIRLLKVVWKHGALPKAVVTWSKHTQNSQTYMFSEIFGWILNFGVARLHCI